MSTDTIFNFFIKLFVTVCAVVLSDLEEQVTCFCTRSALTYGVVCFSSSLYELILPR
jgi:uncharacterized membrane protein YgdD (TMEM256/DUF423 family)